MSVTSGKYEIIMIDNGSTLGDGEVTERNDTLYTPTAYFNFANVLIRNKKNLGFAPACNQGFELARGDYIVCLNNDILVWPDWLKTLLNVFDQPLEPPVGIVMPALAINLRDAREAIRLEKVDTKVNAGKYGRKAEFGSLWVIKRETLDKLKEKDGYIFDENFKLGFGEDRDLWDRIRLLGLETYRCHDTRVFHQGNMSIGKVKDRRDYTSKNREYLEKKREARKQ
jgi:GT2 family glycosyltransferase